MEGVADGRSNVGLCDTVATGIDAVELGVRFRPTRWADAELEVVETEGASGMALSGEDGLVTLAAVLSGCNDSGGVSDNSTAIASWVWGAASTTGWSAGLRVIT